MRTISKQTLPLGEKQRRRLAITLGTEVPHISIGVEAHGAKMGLVAGSPQSLYQLLGEGILISTEVVLVGNNDEIDIMAFEEVHGLSDRGAGGGCQHRLFNSQGFKLLLNQSEGGIGIFRTEAFEVYYLALHSIAPLLLPGDYMMNAPRHFRDLLPTLLLPLDL
jgi:hypothetical protein